MTFSVFAVLMIVIVLLVAFVHTLQGFFSATLSAILAVFAAITALSYHETIVEKFLGGAMADSAHAMVLIVLFAVIYFVLRVIFDQAVPGNVRVPAMLDKIGGGIMGAIAGLFAAGVVAVAAQELSFNPSILGYARYAVDDQQVSLPTNGRSQDLSVKDRMDSPNFDAADIAGEQQRMLLPVDDILLYETNRLSSSGALSDGTPLSNVHPDWLQELFGQRLGMEPSAKRVLMGTPSVKTADAKIDNLYLIGDANKTDLPFIDGEYGAIRGSSAPKMTAPTANYPGKPGRVLLVARIRFDPSAGDKLSGGLVRISPGAVRLVAPGVSSTTGEPLQHADYYPIGTLQYRGPNVQVNNKPAHTMLFRPLLVLQNADDYLFVKKDDSAADADGTTSDLNAGVDFVFSVDKSALDAKRTAMKDGAFMEVKRLVREKLDGMKLLPETMLQKDKGSIAVIRRDKMLRESLLNRHLYDDPTAVAASESTPTPAPARTPTPANTPQVGSAPTASTVAFPLEVADAPKVYDRFYTSVTSDKDSGDVTWTAGDGAKAAMTVDNKQIESLSIDGATAADMHGSSTRQFITLAAPPSMMLVQMTGKPKADAAGKAWTWKDAFKDLALVNDKGARIGPPIGAWVKYSDGGTKVSARFSADGSVKVNDIKPAGEVAQVWFVFAVPHGAKITKVVAGKTTVCEQGVEVP